MKRTWFTTTIQSTLLLLFTLFPMCLMFCLAHEGGHALSNLSHGVRARLVYIHPFPFNGFVDVYQPDALTVWDYASGVGVSFIISLLLFLFFWRRRSVSILPFVMLFPWVGFSSRGTLEGLALGIDDFNQVINITGWPAWLFYTFFSILLLVGIFLLVSLFPLLGLEPKDKRVFFVVPAGFLLYTIVSLIVAHLVVPGSRVDVLDHLVIGQGLFVSLKERGLGAL